MLQTDIDLIVLLVIFLWILIVLHLWLMRHRITSSPPVVVYEATGRNHVQDVCAGHSALYVNRGPGGMIVNIELKDTGTCPEGVTISIFKVNVPPEAPVVVRDPLLTSDGNPVAARVPLKQGQMITYACGASADESHRCEFDLKITRI